MTAMIIDTHVHILNFPSLDDLGDKIRTMEDGIAFRTKFPDLYYAVQQETPSDNTDALIATMDRYNVAHALVQARPGKITNEQVAAAAHRHPGRLSPLVRVGTEQVAFGYADDPAPLREQTPEIVAHGIEKLGMKGMGEMLPRTITNEIHPEKIARDFEPLMRTLARYQVPIQIPTGWSQFVGGLYYGDPLWIDEVAGRNPDVPIVITKMGRSIQHLFDNAMMVALRNANVYFDIVGTSPAHLRHATDKLGSERILFGTDWSATWRWMTEPADIYTQRLRTVEAAGLTEAERENVLWRNAARLFKLDVGIPAETARA
jgi:predicted TIM-barrel fold metal-dependent hydrolase